MHCALDAAVVEYGREEAMRMHVESMAALAAYLAEVQAARGEEVRCTLPQALAARVSDAALADALVTGLPMAQEIRRRILRGREGAVLTARLRYRQGVRLLAGSILTAEEAEALEIARAVAAKCTAPDAKTSFGQLYTWVCGHVRYVHTGPGQKGYDRLVCAAGALLDGQANCQGFADVMYLLCGLCGIPCEYRCGRGQRQLHVWNAVCLNGAWQDADASKGARTHDI